MSSKIISDMGDSSRPYISSQTRPIPRWLGTCYDWRITVWLVKGIWVFRSLVLIFSLLTPISCSSLDKYKMAPAFETVIFDKTNELRASLNLAPLSMVHDLNTKAKAWSKAQSQGACGRFKKLCHKYPIENVAWTSRASLSPSEAEAVLFEMWKKSPGHYKNLISPNSKIGIGIHKTSKGYWATQIFQK